MKKPFVVTTAIDYANGAPHLGHVYEKVLADAIGKGQNLDGGDNILVLGTDEHGQKTAEAAKRAGLSPLEYVDGTSAVFKECWKNLGLDTSCFVRTTSAEHARNVHNFLLRIEKYNPEALYEGLHSGYYCVGCEAFLPKAKTSCEVHPAREAEWVSEPTWFFRLSGFKEDLKKFFSEYPDWIHPEERRNEILSLLDEVLPDVSISRPEGRVPWGLPFKPTSDGTPQTTYVWLDALPSYLSALGVVVPPEGDLPDDSLWPADLQVVGKDISRFHALLWPALLLAAELPLPKKLLVHGFVEFAGRKLAKSDPVAIDVRALTESLGPDALRYLLLRLVPTDTGGVISKEILERTYKAELSHGLGNLASRILTLVDKKLGGIAPEELKANERTEEFLTERDNLLKLAQDALEDYQTQKAAAALYGAVKRTNNYLTDNQPWLEQQPEGAAEPGEVLYFALLTLVLFAVAYSPFLPFATESLWESLGGESLEDRKNLQDKARGVLTDGKTEEAKWQTKPIVPLFAAKNIMGWPEDDPTFENGPVEAKTRKRKSPEKDILQVKSPTPKR